MASEEPIPFGSPPFRLSDLGPCKLSWSVPSYSSRLSAQMWVFWSTNNDELQHVHPQIRATGDTIRGDAETKKKIKWILQQPETLACDTYLVQFWGLVSSGGRMYLTTCDQPFALSYNNNEGMKELCEYRKLCLEYLIPVREIILQEEELDPIERVFYSGLPEYVLDVSYYSRNEYPLYDYAFNRVEAYWAVPVQLPPSTPSILFPTGVLDILSADSMSAPHEILKMLKDVSLYGENKYDRISCSYFICPSTCQKREITTINKVLRVVRDTHQLLLAQTWMLANSVEALASVGQGSCIHRIFQEFPDASRLCLIPVGKGVVGKAFASKSASFCRDVEQLSIKEYPLAPNARKIGLSGCFAVCLQSSCSKNCTYTLEFFLPSDEKYNGDPSTLLHMLMLTLKVQLQSSFKIASGQELGHKLFVEIIKVSSDDTLDSFEICHNSGSESTLGVAEVHNARGMMPPHSSSRQLDAIHNSINVVHEQQIGIVGSPPAPELVQNVVSITHQQSNVELDTTNRARDGVSLAQSGNEVADDLRKQGLVYILESQPWDYS